MGISEHELSILDFKSTSTSCIRFASDGSTDSRAPYTEVEWINYCPDVFRILQGYGKIDFDDYMVSIRGAETLRQLISHGKSNSILYLSHDDRFVVKAVHKPEMKVFIEKLPNYYHHVRKYRNTLLTKFYGFHVVKQSNGQKVYFVVMGNVLHSDLYIHKRFELRCLSQNRSSNIGSGLENELDIVFHLDTSTRNQLMTQIKYDCKFLEELGVVDYCLLLGISISSPSPPSPHESVQKGSSSPAKSPNKDSCSPSQSLNKGSCSPSQSLNKGSCSPNESLNEGSCSPAESLNKGSCSPAESLNKGSCSPAQSTGSDDEKSVSSLDSLSMRDAEHDSYSLDAMLSPHQAVEPANKLGTRIAARAVRKNLAHMTAAKGKGNNVNLFFEVTNIHQEFSLMKRVESVLKSLQSDSHGGNPKAYSTNFQDFICQIFPENDSYDDTF